MMDRNREARRAPMAAVNGGPSRRRQPRSTNLRDSPGSISIFILILVSFRFHDVFLTIDLFSLFLQRTTELWRCKSRLDFGIEE